MLCSCCNLPIHAVAMTMVGSIDGKHYVAAFCTRCAGRMAKLPASAHRRLCLAAENRIGKNPMRYAVKACADEFEASALQVLAADPATFEQVQALIFEG